MPTQVDPAHNIDALLLGTGEFSFSNGAVSPADAQARGWLNFGNIMAFTPDVKPTKITHTGSYRGLRTIDRQAVTQIQTNYKLKCDEWNLENLRILFGASDTTAFTQSSLSGANGAVLAFATTNAVIGKWYDILTASSSHTLVTSAVVSAVGSGYVVGDTLTVAGGTGTSATLTVAAVDVAGKVLAVTIATTGDYTVNPSTPNSATGGTGTGVSIALTFGGIAQQKLRNLTTVTFSGKTEGTDFVLDLLLGRVKFLTAQAANLTPVITCAAITAGSENSFFGLIPMLAPRQVGYGRLQIYDQRSSGNKVVLDHVDFSCDITLDASSEVDGTKWAEITIDVLVTTDKGIVNGRNASANSGVSV